MKSKFTKLTACLSLLIACCFIAVPAAISQTVLLNPASPFTVPAGVTQIKVECWGGGGGGGGATGNQFGTRYGSGGGGGAFNTGNINVSPGQVYTVTIGNGGTAASGAAGTAGAASSVAGPGGTITANPGAGGASNGGAGGAGGSGTFNGGSGAVGTGGVGGAGGGGAGNAGAGSGATAGIGSPNAAPYKGGAGAGGQISTNSGGLTGSAPGGGGGGGNVFFSTGARSGGAGAAGQVIITYCTNFSLSGISTQTPICTGTGTSTISLTSSASGLPAGSYTVTYSRSLPSASGLTAPMTVSTAGAGSFTAAGLTSAGTSTITVTNIATNTGSCSNSVSANNVANVTVNQSPSLFTIGGGGAYCSGSGGVPITLSGSQANVNYQLFNGPTPGATLPGTGNGLTFPNITTGGTYTIVATHTVGGCTITMTGTATVTVNPLPVISTFTNSSPVHCIGTVSSVLAATGTVPSTGTLFTDNFNGTPTFAAAGSNSGGGTIFSQRSSGYAAGALTTITNNDASPFMIATINAFGSATTNSTLTSAVVNTTAYTSLNLSFRHSYGKGSEAGVSVQVSTDGGTNWSNISTAGTVIGTNTYTANVGANNNFVAASINLGSFINNANLRIRFNYTGTTPIGTFWWAIDDVTLNGQFLPLFSYAASTGPGLNGLPVNASTPLASNKTITVNPTVTTTYTLTEQDPVTSCSVSSTTTVTVNQNSTMTLTSGAGTAAQTICMPGALTDIVYTVGGGATGASITAGLLPAGLNASFGGGAFTISGTPTQFGNFSYTITTAGPCNNVSLSGTLSVNTAPGLTCPPDETINTDPGVCFATRTYNAPSTGFPAPTVSYLVNGDFINFPYDFPLGVTTVEVLAEGACSPDASCSFTVTVEDHEAPTPDIAILPDITGECSATVTDFPTATDACDGAFTGTTTDPLTYTVQGTFTVTWSFTDLKGNISTQIQTVIVNDVTAPVISCPATQTFCATLANSFTIPALVATDNCTISSTSYQVTGATTRSGTGTDASGLFNPGISTISWTVIDGNNNTSTCSTTVNVNEIPLVPTVAGIVNVCPYLGTGDQIPYTATSVGATNYTWTVPQNVNVISGAGTSTITLTFNNAFAANGNKQLRVRASNACGVSPQAIYYLLTQYPSTPNPISGPTNVCSLIGTATTATYSIPPATSAVAYLWIPPAGTSITHPNGPGINDTIINLSFNNSFAGGQLTVFGRDSCGTSGARTFNIPRVPSSTPGLIGGPTNVCSNILPGGSPAVYTIRAVSGATSYTWSAPAGAITTHPNGAGANDTTFTIQYPSGFSSGTISVSSTNGCGTSGLRSLAVNKLNAATPSVIDVIQLGFCEDAGGRVYSYTLSAMPANATSVQWTVPIAAGASLLTGQGTTSITVSYPSTAVQGSVTAQSINSCATSTIRTTAVKLPACPPPAGFTKSGDNNQLKQSVQPGPLADNKLVVKVSPNPTVSDFAIQVLTAGKERIDVRIIDMQGREFKRLTVMPYQTINIGSELKAGSYFVEIVQGEKRTTQKLMKF